MNDNLKSAGKLIYNQRTELGITQKEVADFVGVSEATVSRWESGHIDNMRRDRIAALAKVLKISPLAIMGIDNLPPTPPPIDQEDKNLLQAYHNASEETKDMVRYALRNYWPAESSPPETAPTPQEAPKPRKQVPRGQTPTLPPVCQRVFQYIEAEADDSMKVHLALDTYKKLLLDPSVANFIKETINELEEKTYGSMAPFDDSRACDIIAEEILSKDFKQYYMSHGPAGRDKLLKRIRSRFK